MTEVTVLDGLIGMTVPVCADILESALTGQWVRVHWCDADPEWGIIDENIGAIKDIRVYFPFQERNKKFLTVGYHQIGVVCGVLSRFTHRCGACSKRFECFTE